MAGELALGWLITYAFLRDLKTDDTEKIKKAEDAALFGYLSSKHGQKGAVLIMGTIGSMKRAQYLAEMKMLYR